MPRRPIYDERMLMLADYCQETGICDTQAAFLESIGFTPGNISNLRRGKQHFTVSHLIAAAKKYKVNLNWLCGLSEQMFMVNGKSSLQMLKEAVKAVEAEHGK